jgi:alcohol dehydrogenase (NADP+)
MQFLKVLAVLVSLAAQSYSQGFELVTPTPGKGPLTKIPILGLGTYLVNLNIQNSTEVIAGAIQNGYRSFDTAAIYNNQKQLAPGFVEGLKRTGLKREDLWITSKLWNNRHGGDCERGLNETLAELGLEYLDLYLMHFPVGNGRVFDHVAVSKSFFPSFILLSSIEAKASDRRGRVCKPSSAPQVHEPGT